MEAWPPTLQADENSPANFTISVGYGALLSNNQVIIESKILEEAHAVFAFVFLGSYPISHKLGHIGKAGC